MFVCEACEQKLPKCSYCGIITKNYTLNDNDILCYSCQKSASNCSSCKVPLLRKYYSDEYGRKFCAKCWGKNQVCDFCGNPTGEISYCLEDGRIACGYCHSDAVNSVCAARDILNEIISFLHTCFGISTKHFVDMRLVSAKELNTRRGRYFVPTKGYDIRIHGFFQLNDGTLTAFIEKGQPKRWMFYVISHEYAHAWQSENLLLSVDARIVEGFAERVSYKTLLHFGLRDLAENIFRRKDVYGKGFQEIREIEGNIGEGKVVDELLRIYRN